MSFLETLETSLLNLSRRKMRTALTMLGMVFGVGAVIAMLSIGAGAERAALDALSQLGLDRVVVKALEIRREERAEIRKKSLGVSLRDAEALREAVASVEEVLPRVEINPRRIIAPSSSSKAKVTGVSASEQRTASLPLRDGRLFDRLDEASHAQVCIISEQVRKELFGLAPAIGRELKIDEVWFEVVGVLASNETDRGIGMEDVPVASSSREIFIPVTTAMRKFDRDPTDSPLNELLVRVKKGHSPVATAAMITPLLNRLHGGAEDYEVIVPEALLQQSRRTQRIFNLVMGSIAGISLLVGGIGIMNIMLASVLERTREIGVRRAVGARPADVRLQFLVEAFVISVLGGIAGIVIGILLAKMIAAWAGWSTVITASSIILATGVSMSVGLLSGLYPAARAAKLNPIEALRYE
jgi:putative ABC transport system permease protein